MARWNAEKAFSNLQVIRLYLNRPWWVTNAIYFWRSRSILSASNSRWRGALKRWFRHPGSPCILPLARYRSYHGRWQHLLFGTLHSSEGFCPSLAQTRSAKTIYIIQLYYSSGQHFFVSVFSCSRCCGPSQSGFRCMDVLPGTGRLIQFLAMTTRSSVSRTSF